MSGSGVRLGKLNYWGWGIFIWPFSYPPFLWTHSLLPSSSSLPAHQRLLTADFWLLTSEGAKQGHDWERAEHEEGWVGRSGHHRLNNTFIICFWTRTRIKSRAFTDITIRYCFKIINWMSRISISWTSCTRKAAASRMKLSPGVFQRYNCLPPV